MSDECASCGRLIENSDKQQDGINGDKVPDSVSCCWSCWKKIPPDKRIMITVAFRDRAIGGVLAEMAAALDSLDQHNRDSDDWKDA